MCTHMCIYMCAYVYTQEHVCAYIQTCMRKARMYTCIYMNAHTNERMHSQIRHAYKQTHALTRCARTHACTRPHKHTTFYQICTPLLNQHYTTFTTTPHSDIQPHWSVLCFCHRAGVDWRILAERFGIAGETISRWEEMKHSLPMGKVLTAWAENPGATVRLLHRHLMSPQMRCTLLAKRISDYYEVDWRRWRRPLFGLISEYFWKSILTISSAIWSRPEAVSIDVPC